MPENNSTPNLSPPSGSPEQAQKYLGRLIDLLNREKVAVTHTDISKLDPSSLQDHYYMTLNDYHVEISHTKKADTGEDFYILLFNNLKQIRDGCSEKIILAYINLTKEQYELFKRSAQIQFDKIRAREDARKFAEIMNPIDQALENLNNSDKTEATSVPEIPEPINFAEAPSPEPSVSENPVSTESLPEIPIFNEPVPQTTPQNLSPQTPTI